MMRLRTQGLWRVFLLGLPVTVCLAGCFGSADRSTSTVPGSAQTTAESPSVIAFSSPPGILAQCRRTARRVGYAVPCPMLLPKGLKETGRTPGSSCALHIVGAALMEPHAICVIADGPDQNDVAREEAPFV